MTNEQPNHGMRGLRDELYGLGLSMSEFARYCGVCLNTIKRLDRGLSVKPATYGRVLLGLDKARLQVDKGFNRSVKWKDLKREKMA